jgi:exopolysaccharide biosynthesis protein
MIKKFIVGAFVFFTTAPFCLGQLKWENVDSFYQPLPGTVHIFKSTDSIEGKPSIAFYVIADLKDRKLIFTTDTSYKRRLIPLKFYEKNNQPLIVVNGTFFDFASNRNLNTVIKNGKLVSYNLHSIPLKGKDTLTYLHTFRSAIGISKKRNADVTWLYSDTMLKRPFAFQEKVNAYKDSVSVISKSDVLRISKKNPSSGVEKTYRKWKMNTAIGGGPVLVQDSKVQISNNEERMFTGKAIDDKHPRTAMGYTTDGKLIILVIQGRFTGIAEGASLIHLATILTDLGCKEALNLDGGGSSCLLVNVKETIKPSDKEGERAIPAVFMIKVK